MLRYSRLGPQEKYSSSHIILDEREGGRKGGREGLLNEVQRQLKSFSSVRGVFHAKPERDMRRERWGGRGRFSMGKS